MYLERVVMDDPNFTVDLVPKEDAKMQRIRRKGVF